MLTHCYRLDTLILTRALRGGYCYYFCLTDDTTKAQINTLSTFTARKWWSWDVNRQAYFQSLSWLFYGTLSLQILYSDEENPRQEERACQLWREKKLYVFWSFPLSFSFCFETSQTTGRRPRKLRRVSKVLNIVPGIQLSLTYPLLCCLDDRDGWVSICVYIDAHVLLQMPRLCEAAQPEPRRWKLTRSRGERCQR